MKSPEKNKAPSILLIGVGSFGEKHLQKLLLLQEKGVLSLAGAVVATNKTRQTIAKRYGIPVWTKLTDDLLRSIDAVDIVTPPETHKKLALRCLPHAHVLVEKPIALSSKDARLLKSAAEKHKRILMVGHVFRFSSAVKELERLLARRRRETVSIRGEFINPLSTDVGRDTALEIPHLLDIVDAVMGKPKVEAASTRDNGRINTTEIKYRGNINALFKTGWDGNEKKRFITFSFSNDEIRCDLLGNQIEIFQRKTGKRKSVPCRPTDALTEELERFINIIRGKHLPYPGAEEGIRLIEIIEKARASTRNAPQRAKPRVAVIGGGIFGASCAIELGDFCDVTLLEKNGDIMREASFVNQYRHHWGYHYPRSDETVRDIKRATADFERLYNRAIIRNFPTYYLVAKSGSKVSAKEYLRFCKKHNLPFTKKYPNKRYLDRTKTSLSLETFEPIYNYKKLAGLVRSYLKASSHIKIRLNTEAVFGKMGKTGRKTLTLKKGGVKYRESFDYVINATYARHNAFLHWFNFPIKPVRIDLVEALIVKLPMPKISLAIMDGPFTNLVPTSEDSLFTLVHIRESMLERYVPKDGLPHKRRDRKTAILKTLSKSAEWFPILSKAEIVDVRYVFRAVNAYREYDDARPSDIVYHGFGMWSVLGGKIVNCTTVAKNIAAQIKDNEAKK